MPVLRRPREKDDEGEETRASHSFADAAPSASLPPELWDLIADSVPETHMLSFALICRDTWGVVKDRSLRRRKRRGPEEENGAAAEDSRPGRPRPRGEPRLLRTNLAALYDQCERGETTVSESWIAWACRCFLESTRPEAAAEAASFKRQITRVAAHQGHADALEMMRTDRFPMHDRLCDAAAIGGRLEVLQWALGDHKAGASGRGSSGSGRSWMGGLGSASALDREWPSGQSVISAYYLDETLFHSAAIGGDLEVLKYLRAKGCPWDSRCCVHAAMHGNLEALKWLRREGCPWDMYVCNAAALGGDLATLEWLRARGRPWDEMTCAAAAGAGHLEALKRLKEWGCPWDEWTCSEALLKGHYHVWDWAKRNGCPCQGIIAG